MQISKYIHSCLLIEEHDARILVDPGTYSFAEKKIAPEDFQNIAAIIITHAHKDHASPEALKIILTNNPQAIVYGNTDTKELLSKENIPVELFESGEKKIEAFTVEAFPTRHPKIIANIPQNTAYLFNKILLVTGDTLDTRLDELAGVKVLAAPLMASWGNQMEMTDYIKRLAPKIFLPVHDGYIKDFVRIAQYPSYKKYLAEANIDVHPLEPGETLTI